jgi:hypothetical protein
MEVYSTGTGEGEGELQEKRDPFLGLPKVSREDLEVLRSDPEFFRTQALVMGTITNIGEQESFENSKEVRKNTMFLFENDEVISEKMRVLIGAYLKRNKEYPEKSLSRYEIARRVLCNLLGYPENVEVIREESEFLEAA